MTEDVFIRIMTAVGGSTLLLGVGVLGWLVARLITKFDQLTDKYGERIEELQKESILNRARLDAAFDIITGKRKPRD
jgi:hypothetical protein